MKKIILSLGIVVGVGVGAFLYKMYLDYEKEKASKFVSGNGRIEATEVSIAAKLAGRIEKIMVEEGDFVTVGLPLALMQTNVLHAQLKQAEAQRNLAITSEASAKAMIDIRISEKEAAEATVLQKESNLKSAHNRYERSKALSAENVTSKQEFENHENMYLSAQAELAIAKAGVKQAEAAINSAKAEAAGALASIQAAEADIARIQADIDDSLLIAPREGRIQYRIAQPGEVLAAGGRVLNLVDLTDVYMTFFLPEEVAGKVALGSEVRLILDAVPDLAIPANVSYVASVAQFTPKTVETKSERQKLMFRVKARIDPLLLKQHIKLIKTGIPGVAWVKVDQEAKWPKFLEWNPKP